MSITIKIDPILCRYTNNRDNAEVNGSTVGECLDDLVEQFPAIRNRLLDKDGKLSKYVAIFVNQASSDPEKLIEPVRDGDQIHIQTIVAGGRSSVWE